MWMSRVKLLSVNRCTCKGKWEYSRIEWLGEGITKPLWSCNMSTLWQIKIWMTWDNKNGSHSFCVRGNPSSTFSSHGRSISQRVIPFQKEAHTLRYIGLCVPHSSNHVRRELSHTEENRSGWPMPVPGGLRQRSRSCVLSRNIHDLGSSSSGSTAGPGESALRVLHGRATLVLLILSWPNSAEMG